MRRPRCTSLPASCWRSLSSAFGMRGTPWCISSRQAAARTRKRRSAARRSKWEKDSFVSQALEFSGRDMIQLGGAARTVVDPLVDWFDDVEQGNLPPEVALIECSSQYSFEHALQLAEGELLREKLESNGGVVELVCEP